MTLLTAPDDLRLEAGDEPGAPLLRLRRAGEPQVRSLPLAAGKSTVGSSPQCQVCLPSPDVRPLQCLITLEANATSVTRWATGVQLNGRDFSKSTLKDGDRLTIGSWELEFDRGGSAKNFDAATEASNEDLHGWPVEEPGSLPQEERASTDAVRAIDMPNSIEAPGLAEVAASHGADSVPAASEPQPKAGPASDGNSSRISSLEASLIQHLWTANFQARRRAKALINGIRAARFHADAMAADLSAMETELDLARAAYDSHIGNDDRLQEDLAEQRRQHEERLAPLLEEVNRLKADLATATAALAAQVADYEALAAKLAAEHEAAKAPVVDDAALKRAAELEAALAAQSQQLEAITLRLQTAQDEQERLARLYEAESRRAAALETSLAEMQAAADATASEATLEPVVVTEPAPAASLWQNVQPIEEEAPVEAEPLTSWAAFEPAKDEPSFAPAIEQPGQVAVEPGPESFPWTLPTTLDEAPSAANDESQPVVDERASMLSASVKQQPEPTVAPKQEAPAWAAAPADKPASEFASPSFIDKYRHLLDDEDASLSPLPGKSGRPVIDDEFLSPAKAETCASPADESDEALEAYMANMMRRVKSSASSFAHEPSVRAASESTPSVISPFAQSSGNSAEGSPELMGNSVSDQPLSFEELKQATRKVPLASDLAALREIANSTARTAIATHSHRQTRETAITKIIVAITATVSAGYLMASAPAIDTWQFWAGAATCAVGVVAAVQVLVLERRGRHAR